eukprot:gnl/MRDRNA2_/MRDRNA2_72504_c1_seq1.p1 gnl/MRDRNA2_/MRDRNA2_72504_c1~~gnl/MRDRNA2_/MRDRNA2_72504_c1_seq1.p1  ORF type:complete len:1636 (+),score=316.11 gnl/MRDRNA2_/MRDRNA2_72504_c1_seq1:35-4909(+)
MKKALDKLKLPKKKKDELHLVLRDRYQGTKALNPEMDLEAILRDGATLVLTTERPLLRVQKPPRWPWPGADSAQTKTDGNDPGIPAGGEDCADEVEELQTSDDARAAFVSIPPIRLENKSLGDWHGPWPVLEGNVLPLLREATAKTKGFIEKDMGQYIAFDYSSANANEMKDMFPDLQRFPKKSRERLLSAVRRECRGLLVCATTGIVLARRLPKFFNIDELEESNIHELPTGGEATQKLDGSLVSPLLIHGEVRWAGKSTMVPAVEAFVAKNQCVRQSVMEALSENATPIFEWCEAGPPVGVIRHMQDRLVLLAVRHNVTGEFWPRQRLENLSCDLVSAIDFTDLQSLVPMIRSQVGSEGVVVAWPQGRMVKLKTSWWITLSASQRKGMGQPAMALYEALQSMPLSSIHSSDVWQAALTADDDQMSLVHGCLPPEAQSALRAFIANMEQGIAKLDQELREWAECVQHAAESDLANVSGDWPLSMLVAYQHRNPTAVRELRKFLIKMAKAGQLLGLEALVGTTWRGGRQVTEFCGHLGTFEKAPPELITHVLNVYLPCKISEYMGYPISEETAVRVPRLYEPCEGKIKGMWEQFVDQGIIDLRVDLQPRGKVFDFHGGDADFAHWQIQYGTNDNCRRSTKAKDGDRHGAFASVLMRTGFDVEFGLLQHAFELSFKSQKVVKLDPSPSKISYIYLDLDGVLVDFEAGFQEKFSVFPDAKERWQHIEKTPGFYNDLPWTKDGKMLWQHVQKLNVPVTILTGIPEGTLGQRSAEEKAAWVKRELGNVELVCCLSREKPQHSGQGSLLIDDRPQKGWEQVGGRQIVHHNVPNTLSALVDMGLGCEFAACRDRIAFVDRLTEDLRAARAQANVVAIDAEWPPDRAGTCPHRAVILQMAFQPRLSTEAFVVDMLSWDEELETFIRELLCSDLPKLIFGDGDADRLGIHISGAVNLQDGSMSLADQARRAGLVLKKSKQLQAADWSVRPLREEQLVYAATDALVLLELNKINVGHAVKFVPRTQSAGRNVTVEYIGAFLTPDARKKLLRNVPPRFAEVIADHMTLEWMPKSVKGLAVGMPVKITADGVGEDGQIQALSTTTNELQPRSGHVTISHRQDVASVEAGKLSFKGMTPFVLDCVLGVGLVHGRTSKEMLPDHIASKVEDLKDGQPGQSARFENLTDGQRYALHILADDLGLEHRSEGKKGTEHRKLILTVPKRRKQVVSQKGFKEDRSIVKDARKFAAIFGDIPGQQLHGRVTRNEILWEPGIAIPPILERLLSNARLGHWKQTDRLTIILRGFPGSGKSSLSVMLRKKLPAEIISADDFWAGQDKLQEAHEQCRQIFLQMLKDQKPLVIIDNTNVRKSDYAFYQSRSESEGYQVVVLEMVCDSTTELEQFRKRSKHDVPGSAVGAMWGRWERDPTALRIAPYVPQKLMAWLQEQNMLGHQPHTHLIMPRGPFLSVPAAAQSEFHERHALEWDRNYISEIGRPHCFQLFFDIDGLNLDSLLVALPQLRVLAGVPLMVTGIEGPPPGYHIFAPGVIVDSSAALALRQKWIDAVPSLQGYVDDQLYQNPQLRLLGSRKLSKDGVDTGRVHKFVGRLDSTWECDDQVMWQWSDVSIHPPPAEQRVVRM